MDCIKETKEVRKFTLTEAEVKDAIERRMRDNDNLAGGELTDPVVDQIEVTLIYDDERFGAGSFGAEVVVVHAFAANSGSI